jgi:hypothetical protein
MPTIVIIVPQMVIHVVFAGNIVAKMFNPRIKNNIPKYTRNADSSFSIIKFMFGG